MKEKDPPHLTTSQRPQTTKRSVEGPAEVVIFAEECRSWHVSALPEEKPYGVGQRVVPQEPAQAKRLSTR